VRTKELWDNLDYKKDFGNEELFRKIEGHLKEPLISPLIADDETLEGLPFTYIMTCGFDFIRDDGIMFHEKLKHLKIETIMEKYLINLKGSIHNNKQYVFLQLILQYSYYIGHNFNTDVHFERSMWKQ
jgi:acetyl esterase/lipase